MIDAGEVSSPLLMNARNGKRSNDMWRWALVVCLLCMNVVITPARASDRFTVAQYGISSATFPWAVALQEGYLKQQGLDVDGFIGSNGGGTSIRNMLASSVPFAEVSLPAVVAAIKSGLKLKIIYSAVNNMGGTCWVVRKDSPLKSIADLKGHKAGFNQPQSATEMALRMVLQRAGLDKSVQTIATGGSGNGLTAVDAGGIDAAPQPELEVPDKYRVLFSVTKYVPNLVWQVGITTDEFAATHPDTIRKLIAARRRAVEFIYAHPLDAAKIYSSVWGVSETDADAIVAANVKLRFWSDGDFDMSGVREMVSGMKLVGLMDDSVDIPASIDKSYLR